ncbi:MAG: ABC transporter permease [Dorea sp.]|nr:ABC transporter permease [Dorea sp.]
MLENIRISFQGILSHKLRSFLTTLGIIIGIAAIIAIVSTIKGTNEQIKSNLIGSGTNTVTVSLYQSGWAYEFQYMPIPAGVPVFEESLMEDLKTIDHVEGVSEIRTRNYVDNMYYENTNLSSSSVYGIDQSYFDVESFQVIYGRGFSAKEYEKAKKVCVVDKTFYDGYMKGTNPVGKIIDISGKAFVIVGVVDKASSFEPTINSMEDYYNYMNTSSGTVYIPGNCWPIVFQYDEPQTYVLRAENTDAMTDVGKDAAKAINSLFSATDTEGTPLEYKSADLLSMAQDLQDLSKSTNFMLIAIASISLLVGGIGVMNIMLVSVTERTREIGLKKALGAKKKSILLQFLTEAAVLSSIGGIMGVLCGLGLAKAISVLAGVPSAVSVPAIIVSVLFSMVVGIVFGLIPSVKAANLNPIDALRYE